MAMESTEDLTTYLKTAMELEATIYSLEEAKKNAEAKLKYQTPRRDRPIQPYMQTFQEPVYNPPQVHEQSDKKGSLVWGIILILVELFAMFNPKLGYTSGFSAIIHFAIFGLGVYLIIRPSSKHNEEAEARASYERNYNALKENYERKVKEEKEAYDKKMQVYQKEYEKAEKKYQHELDIHRQAEDALFQLNRPINAAKRALDSLYEAGVIYPKYRNLIAVSTFYEYFASGRCTELTGPDGAYNLYESELRQNIIINRLDKIINQLEEIKANQYALYMELLEGRKISQRISADVSRILSETRAQSQIEAVCLETTAKNAEAIKYISLLNSFKK